MDQQYDTFVFNHIPKCGGTSFRALLNESALNMGIMPNEIYIPGSNGIGEDKNLDQMSIREKAVLRRKKTRVFASHCRFDVHIKHKLPFKNPFFFTILRDPLKRFLSHYNFFYKKLGYMECKGVELNELSEEKLDFLLEDLSNIHCKYLANYRARDIYIVRWENVFRVAKYNLQYEYGAYGVLEMMDEMIPHINLLMPDWLKLEARLPTLNTQKKKAKKAEVRTDIIDKILQFNKFDIELYEFAKNYYQYKFDNLEKLEQIKAHYNLVL